MAIAIYIRLLDGAQAYVPVSARPKEKDVFEILDNEVYDPDDYSSIWEFFAGDTVRCEMTSRGWFAVELIHSILPNRDVFALIFSIVQSLGEVGPADINDPDQNLLERFCEITDIPQLNHPLVVRWRESNC